MAGGEVGEVCWFVGWTIEKVHAASRRNSADCASEAGRPGCTSRCQPGSQQPVPEAAAVPPSWLPVELGASQTLSGSAPVVHAFLQKEHWTSLAEIQKPQVPAWKRPTVSLASNASLASRPERKSRQGGVQELGCQVSSHQRNPGEGVRALTHWSCTRPPSCSRRCRCRAKVPQGV